MGHMNRSIIPVVVWAHGLTKKMFPVDLVKIFIVARAVKNVKKIVITRSAGALQRAISM